VVGYSYLGYYLTFARHSGAIVGMKDQATYPMPHLASGSFGEAQYLAACDGSFFELVRPLRSIKWIADSQTKNQAPRHKVDERDEPEAGRKRVRSIIEKADHVWSGKSSELSG